MKNLLSLTKLIKVKNDQIKLIETIFYVAAAAIACGVARNDFIPGYPYDLPIINFTYWIVVIIGPFVVVMRWRTFSKGRLFVKPLILWGIQSTLWIALVFSFFVDAEMVIISYCMLIIFTIFCFVSPFIALIGLFRESCKRTRLLDVISFVCIFYVSLIYLIYVYKNKIFFVEF